ncbi:MAG TPA: haloacid dehalogenase, partial [Candidatus Methylomirabilis sp.]|nr:haloacid dehalogenase [Candidatus Methylomirabilis sp.]
MDFTELHAFLFDLDGCVYTGNMLVPGVQGVIQLLRDKGRRLLFLTNNSREAGEEIRMKLDRLGVRADREEVLSAAEIVGPLVRERF